MNQLYTSTDALEAAALTIPRFEEEIQADWRVRWEDTKDGGEIVTGFKARLKNRGYVFDNIDPCHAIELRRRIGFAPMSSLQLVNNSEKELRNMAKKLVLEGLYAHLKKDDGKSESFVPRDAEARKKLAMSALWPEKNQPIPEDRFYYPSSALIFYSNGFNVQHLVGEHL